MDCATATFITTRHVSRPTLETPATMVSPGLPMVAPKLALIFSHSAHGNSTHVATAAQARQRPASSPGQSNGRRPRANRRESVSRQCQGYMRCPCIGVTMVCTKRPVRGAPHAKFLPPERSSTLPRAAPTKVSKAVASGRSFAMCAATAKPCSDIAVAHARCWSTKPSLRRLRFCRKRNRPQASPRPATPNSCWNAVSFGCNRSWPNMCNRRPR
mmetsp:Transcript_93500/g.261522  ORF Transcript_93500/g.261522 Transcript_93500/m.261522 type:complete len:214 (-) Transcript_93500:416-1057(-)